MGTPGRRLLALFVLEMFRLILLARLSISLMQEIQNSNEECVVRLWDCIAFLEMSVDF